MGEYGIVMLRTCLTTNQRTKVVKGSWVPGVRSGNDGKGTADWRLLKFYGISFGSLRHGGSCKRPVMRQPDR
ncbi:hypothetical protein BDN72DRAFT_830445 [Pluteus cervinus]|uniref:Uncharacterized protein n=1 Tax=Pluteus cervinus TaxID=181527 RepID=A0ACD3BGN9_9AGAR|nr:hypothetical protein BDN72DRAFT_830445 [Pluteus cervinus]